MGREEIRRHIHENLGRHVGAVAELVRQPSVSLEGTGLVECANLVARHLTQIGCTDVSLVDVGDGFPGVWGRFDAGARKTLLVYGHYDVRPLGAEAWSSDPYGGDVVAAQGFPSVLTGRGSVASKGPLQAWLNAVGSMFEVEGGPPVNLLFLIEGAEILGSLNYLKLASERADALAAATALYGPSVSEGTNRTIRLILGYKGLIYAEIVSDATRWGRGPQGGPVHSATNAVVDNVGWRLIQGLASLVGPSGRLQVPELDDVLRSRKPVESWELPLLAKLHATYDGADWNTVIPGLNANTPVMRFRDDISGPAVLDEYLYAPSANVSGLRSGYTGVGTKSFLLPSSATATLDIRIITDLPANEVVERVHRRLAANGFGDFEIKVLGAYDWNQVSAEHPFVRALLDTVETWGRSAEIWPMIGFGGPWAHVPRSLGIPGLLGGAIGFGDRAATSDEFFVIDGGGKVGGLEELENFFVDLAYAYADQE